MGPDLTASADQGTGTRMARVPGHPPGAEAGDLRYWTNAGQSGATGEKAVRVRSTPASR
ncbi:hypothetical protein FAIPA1_70210 [Frankia sp. AiPs1]